MSHSFAGWIPSEKDPGEEIKELRISLGIVEQSTAKEEAVRRMIRHLEAKASGWLLVYDNVESAEQVEEMVPQARNSTRGHVIITTRDQGFVKKREPFSHTSILQLSPLSQLEGIDVLLHYAEKPKEGMEEGELSIGKEICKVLGDLPLALTRAGSLPRRTIETLRSI